MAASNEIKAKLERQAFAKRLTELMSEKGVSTKDLASAVEVSPGAVSQWRKGTSKPSQEKLEQVAAYLQTSALYLSEGYAEDDGSSLFPLSATEAAILRSLRNQVPDDLTIEEKRLISVVRASDRIDATDATQIINMLDKLTVQDFAKVITALQDATTVKELIEQPVYLTEDGREVTHV